MSNAEQLKKNLQRMATMQSKLSNDMVYRAKLMGCIVAAVRKNRTTFQFEDFTLELADAWALLDQARG